MYPKPTVFVVDDDHAVRKSLTTLLRSVDLAVEGFATANEFLAAYSPEQPGCLTLDLRIPGMSGLELQKELTERESALPIIILTGYGDVPTAVQTLQAGAFDFVEKPYQNQKFLDTIQAALRLNLETRAQRCRRMEIESRLAALTDGERKVLDGMMAGHGYKNIASELQISYKTVQARRAQIMKKMGTKDLPGLAHLIVTAYQSLSAA